MAKEGRKGKESHSGRDKDKVQWSFLFSLACIPLGPLSYSPSPILSAVDPPRSSGTEPTQSPPALILKEMSILQRAPSIAGLRESRLWCLSDLCITVEGWKDVGSGWILVLHLEGLS